MVESTYNPFHVSHPMHTTCSDAPQEATLQILMYHRRLADFANDCSSVAICCKESVQWLSRLFQELLHSRKSNSVLFWESCKVIL